MFFEGPEKKVEVLIKPSQKSLRSFGDEYWKKIVQACQAQILSKISSADCDAYLLSESSLFVTNTRMTMITCGRTVLVNAILELLQTISINDIELLVYERKNEHFPEAQHSTFLEDVKRLEKSVPGKIFFYGDEKGHHISLFTLNKHFEPEQKDMTLEVLMHGLSEPARNMFQKGTKRNLDIIRKQSGIWEILPGFKVDDYLFKPMGYSLNAVRDDYYYTIHVTPQEMGSYASFETNFHFTESPMEIVERVLRIFDPEESNVLFFQKNCSKGNIITFDCAPSNYKVNLSVKQDLHCGFCTSFFDYKKN